MLQFYPFRHRAAEWIRKHDLHICYLQDAHLRTKDLHSVKAKGWKKNILSKWTGNKSWGSNTHIWQNRLQYKGHKKRHRRILHNTQGKNLSRRHKYYKHTCTQHRSTKIYKEIPGELQERYRQQHNYSRGFLHPIVNNG